MHLKDKIHVSLQEKALDKAIYELIGPYGDYYIDDLNNNIYFNFKREKLKMLEKLEFNLPSCDDIKKLNRKKYRKFDDSWMNKIIYSFEILNKSSMYNDGINDAKDLVLTAEESDIVLSYSDFKKINIQSKGNVRIHDCSSNSDMNISAKNIKIENCTRFSTNYINLNAEYVEFNRTFMININDLNVNSQLISFNNTEVMYSNNITLNSDMIDTKKTNLKAQNKIKINNTNCDDIEGVYAPKIIYNGKDVTYSDEILMPQLKKQLLEDLNKIKKKVVLISEAKLQEYIYGRKTELQKEPITKILKR
ncbi:MAG: hypothetical protein IJY25_01605 [Bacilli bacterium]|nr:hypothetical protein [Bacilli bacterium]